MRCDPKKESVEEAQVTPEERDPEVDRPSHYTAGNIEAIAYIEDSLGDGYSYFLEGSTKKYLHRWRHKSKDQEGKIRDLEKARWFLDRLIEDIRDYDAPHINQ